MKWALQFRGRSAKSETVMQLGLKGYYEIGFVPRRGSVPNVYSDGSSTFHQAYKVTVYYMPETYGWGSTFGGRPAKLWNPLMHGFGVQANRFGFNVTGTAGIPILVEACTGPYEVWLPLQNGTLTNGSINFSDPQWTNYPSRLYRIRSP